MLKNGTIFEISTCKVNNFFISRHIFMIIVLVSEVTIGISKKKASEKNLQCSVFSKMLFHCLAEKREYSSQTRTKQNRKPGLV